MVTSKKQRSRPTLSRKKVLLGFLLILLVATAVALFFSRKDSDTTGSNSVPANSSSKNTGSSSNVNLNPPTEDQKNAARDESPQESATSSNGKKTVTPIITSYDKQEVRAFVNGVIEDGGTCTATYTHGDDIVTASSRGISDAGHTTCGPMQLTGPVNIQGDWSVVVTYSSSNYYGKSNAKTLNVQ